MEELFKIPNLIQHYQNSHSNLSLLDFIAAHYNQTNHDDLAHEQLPLKHHHHQGLQLFDVLISVMPELVAFHNIDFLAYTPKISPEYHFLYSPVFSPPPQVLI
jgi:hypothetical protein